MGIELDKETIFALAVALLTWFGVFAYLLRLEALTKNLEKLVARGDDEREPK
jgi:hypothetical protein